LALSSNDIANQAIQLIGDNQPPISGVAPNFDSSPAGLACSKLYSGCVATVARQFGWDFSRNTANLAASGGAAPFPWSVEYSYPANGVQVLQLQPTTIADANNPLPVNWVVANNTVAGNQVKVIHANSAGLQAVYTNAPTEATWDPLFRESVVRLLASELAMALFGRPDTAQALIESGQAFESIGETRDS
jgi:uncharacterized protein YraI